MKLSELRQRLEEMAERTDTDPDVRLMTQQGYPFENRIKGVVASDDIEFTPADDRHPFRPIEGDPPPLVIYLVEGGQVGYGSKEAWDAC